MADQPIILASQSPRRRELLQAAGYPFQLHPPDEHAECGVCSREAPTDLVARLALQKARDVALQFDAGLIVGCDTVASYQGLVLGKPSDRNDARRMLQLLRGREHFVLSGLCVWRRPDNRLRGDVVITRLRMDEVSDAALEEYLDTTAWEGKAGAFGYQDGLDWLHVIDDGSESNVVGLPMERLAEVLEEFRCDGGWQVPVRRV